MTGPVEPMGCVADMSLGQRKADVPDPVEPMGCVADMSLGACPVSPLPIKTPEGTGNYMADLGFLSAHIEPPLFLTSGSGLCDTYLG